MTDNDSSRHDYPAPGSAEACELGCCCPAKRNNHGQRAPFAVGTTIGGTTGGWLIDRECTMHATSAYRGALIA